MAKKRHNIDENMPIGKVTVVEDFLPPWDQLKFPPRKVSVTLELSTRSVKYFKQRARVLHTTYQVLMAAVIEHYVAERH